MKKVISFIKEKFKTAKKAVRSWFNNVILKIKKKINRANRAIALWFKHKFFQMEDLYNSICLKIKTTAYNLTPSTIRFHCVSSLTFLKLKKNFFTTPLFYLKRYIFKILGRAREFFINIYIYVKYIFLKHWKFFVLISVLFLSVFLLTRQTSFGTQLTGFMHYFTISPDNDRLFDLYLALAAITGTFLGLYFTAVSITAQTLYTKVNADIHQLLSNVRLSNVYAKSIIVLFVVLLFSILLMVQGVTLGKWNFYIIFVLSFISLTSFWSLGLYIFNFFNPATLAREYVYPRIERNVLIVTDYFWYKYDRNYQGYLQNEVEKDFNTYDIVVKFATKNEQAQTDVLANIINDAVKYLNFYISRKSKIPTDSLWFPQKYEHKKYIMSNSSELEFAQNSGAFLTPKLTNNVMWFEERFINIINKCLETLFKQGQFHLYYSVINRLSALIKGLTQKSRIDEVFFILDNLYNPFLNKTEKLDEFCIYIADVYMSILVDVSLAFNTDLKAGVETMTAKKVLKNRFIHNSRNLPHSIKQKLEDIHSKLVFEYKIEKNIKTTDWHIQELLSNETLKFTKDFFNGISSRILDALELYFNEDFIKNNPDVSISAFVRAYELYQKLSYSLERAKTSYGEQAFKDQYSEYSLIKSTLLKQIIKISPFLKISDKGTPDYAGFIYTVLQREIRDILLDKKSDTEEIIGDLFSSMYSIISLQMGDIAKEIAETVNSGKEKVLIENDIMFYSQRAVQLFIDIMDLSGYVFLFDDIYSKSLKEKIIPVWEKIIKEKGLNSLIQIIEIYHNPPLMGFDSGFQFNLIRGVAHKIEELGLLWKARRPFGGGPEPQPKQVYCSNFVKNICRDDHSMWEPPKGYLIFSACYLLDLADETQKAALLKGWKIANVRKMTELDNEK